MTAAIDIRPSAERTAPAPGRPARWPRLVAAAMVAQPLLLGVNALFHPDVELSADSLLDGAAGDPRRWFAVHVVAAIGALLGAPAAIGLRRLVRGRGRTLADTALAAALLGAAVLPMAFAAEASVLRLAAAADIGEGAALTLVDDYTATPEFVAVGVGVLAYSVAGVLFAVALLRDRIVPRRAAWALLAGYVATAAAPPGTPVGPVAFGLVALASAALAPMVVLATPPDASCHGRPPLAAGAR